MLHVLFIHGNNLEGNAPVSEPQDSRRQDGA
jgi:hypothetical protein